MDVPGNTANEICALLGETEPKPRWAIERIVVVLGEERARAFAAEALSLSQGDISAAAREDGHVRTAGGVFFKLVKDRCDTPTRLRIFYPWRLKDRKGYSEPRRPAPSWDERHTWLAGALRQPGLLRTMKVTLTGRPDKVIQQPEFVVFALKSAALPALPRGLPAPDEAQSLVTVYVTRKHWGTVSGALMADPGDSLIIEGHALYDEAIKGMAVYATKVLARSQVRVGSTKT